jgi:hypothetical protein
MGVDSFDEVRKTFSSRLAPMADSLTNDPIEPMDLANVRENGVRSLAVTCWNCHHRAAQKVERQHHRPRAANTASRAY